MPAERLAVFRRGTNVGVYAQNLFPGGIDAGPKHPSQYRKAVEKTALLIQEGQNIIYEAGFQANKTLILLDILVKNGDAWDAYEVKSSKKLSETYFKDAALQYYVLVEAGLKINSFSLININEDYVLEDEIDIHKLFEITDVTEEVKKRKEYVGDKITEELSILEEEHSPKIEIGTHCFSPYDCDFIGHCWKSIKKPSVFDIPSIEIEKQFDLYSSNKDLSSILNIDSITTIQSKQIKSKLDNEEIIDINSDDKDRIYEINNNIDDYLFLKVLYFVPALPLYKGTRPYQSIPFALAYSNINSKVSDLNYFIAEGKVNPEIEIKAKLDELLKTKKDIVYNGQLNNNNTFDMIRLLETASYYHPEISKDYSNKSVSKALGIKPPWKGISSDIVAAQYYDEILRNHKDSGKKMEDIIKYLKREIEFLNKFWNKINV
jgi:cytochrome c-type biogenesis protein CcmE